MEIKFFSVVDFSSVGKSRCQGLPVRATSLLAHSVLDSNSDAVRLQFNSNRKSVSLYILNTSAQILQKIITKYLLKIWRSDAKNFEIVLNIFIIEKTRQIFQKSFFRYN